MAIEMIYKIRSDREELLLFNRIKSGFVLIMPFQGKEFSQGMKQLVVNLMQFNDIERRENNLKAVWAIEQTARGLGIGQATIRRIMAEYNKNDQNVPETIQRARGKPEYVIPSCLQPVIRGYIREKNLKGQHVSVELLRKHLAKIKSEYDFSYTTLWRTLIRWGFTYGTGKRRSALKERDYVILARRRYLRQKRMNRKSDGTFVRPEVYLDETFINKNHSGQFTWYFNEDGPHVNKPSGKGERIIVVNAITINGWVENAKLVFEAKKKTGDYHGQMDWGNFSKWFKKQLLPNIPKHSIIIMDNASYHNATEENNFPKSNSTKGDLRKWLDDNEIPWGQDLLKAELYVLCKLHEPKPEYKIDKIAETAGHSILRTPQYHPELQPIEKCWGVLKNYMARHCDFTLEKFRENLPRAFSQVTSKTCIKSINKTIIEENNYWEDDKKIDEYQDLDVE
jgi:transposase